MPLNPRNHSVAELVAKLDDLSVSQIEALEEAELAGRARKSLLAAIKEALENLKPRTIKDQQRIELALENLTHLRRGYRTQHV